jgi:hypothetical protein
MTAQIQEILQEATEPLVRLDADRLEEIALGCEELLAECNTGNRTRRYQINFDSRRVERDIGLFKRLLELTNANLTFLRGLSVMRGARLEYGRVPVNICPTAEVEYGNY